MRFKKWQKEYQCLSMTWRNLHAKQERSDYYSVYFKIVFKLDQRFSNEYLSKDLYTLIFEIYNNSYYFNLSLERNLRNGFTLKLDQGKVLIFKFP
jgi:hypothetical protein